MHRFRHRRGRAGVGVTAALVVVTLACVATPPAAAVDRSADGWIDIVRRERAAGGQAGQIRRLPFDGRQPALRGVVEPRDRAHEATRVRVPGCCVELARGCGLDDPAGIHDQHPVTEIGHEVQVVADEDQAHAALAHQPVHDIEHLPLHGHVQRRSGLVRDQDLRVGNQHHRDHDPLSHAAGHLMRIGAHHPLRIADRHGLEHFDRSGPGLGFRNAVMDQVSLHDLVADPHHRVERELGILHHHRDLFTADVAHRRFRQVQQVAALQRDVICFDDPRRADQAQDGAPGHGFARPAFADDPQALFAQGKRHPAHGLEKALPGREPDPEVLHVQQGH